MLRQANCVKPEKGNEHAAADILYLVSDGRGGVQGFALSSRSSQWFERLPWQATPQVGQALLLGCGVVFLTALGAGLAGAVMRRRRSRRSEEPQGAMTARRLALGAVACNLLFVVLYAAVLVFLPESIVQGQVALLAGVLALPFVGVVLALACAAFVIWAWQRGWWRVAGRLHYTLVTASLLVFAVVLWQWNLLGWRW